MKKYSKKEIVIIITFILFVFVSIIGITFAWFSAQVEGNDSASTMVVEMANLKLEFTDTNIIEGDKVLPGWTRTKTFTVENLGDVALNYDIDIIDVASTFEGQDLVYEITSTNNGGTKTETVLPNTNDTLIVNAVINPQIVQTYTIKMTFKETGEDQNIDQGKTYRGKLQITPRISSVAIAGYALDAQGNAIPNRVVELHSDPVSTTTDSSGYYEFRDVQVGNHTIILKNSTNTAEEASKSITLVAGTETKYTNNTLTLENTPTKNINIQLNGNTIDLVVEGTTIYNKIIADNDGGTSDLNINFAQTSEAGNTNGLYYTDDTTVSTYGENGEIIYYYRGDVDNNWVAFGGYLWRIVRTTSEEGVKLAYAGDGTSTTSAFISTTTAFNQTAMGSHYYVGYTYNTNGYNTLPQTNSLIKNTIDDWYLNTSTLTNNDKQYLSETAVYCSDRSSISSTYFPTYQRLVVNKRPSFACPETSESKYTVDSSTGNGFLTNPIALLTQDEVHYAGLIYYTQGKTITSYIMDNSTGVAHWWTMSPFRYDTSLSGASLFVIGSGGYHGSRVVNDSNCGVRPSVSLKSCVTYTGIGNGSQSRPYQISNVTC